MKAKPTFNKIIVKAMQESDVSRGGIILPPSVERQQTLVGIVQAVGPGRITDAGVTIPCCVKVGDKILYSRHVGFPIEIDNEKLTTMPDVEAIVIFDDENAGESTSAQT